MMTANYEADVRSLAARYAPPGPKPDSAAPHSLAQAVEVAVHKVDTNFLRPIASTDARLAFQSRTLLALLTFCYARQVYSSTVIASQLRREFNSLRVHGDDVPDAPALLRFRCENRGPLSFCLKLALRFLAEDKIRQGIVTHVKEAHIEQEADRRIIMAMFTDSLELGKVAKPEALVESCYGVALEQVRVH